MRPAPNLSVSAVAMLCLVLPSLGCSSHLTTGSVSPAAGAGPSQSAVPPQFAEVADADWTIEKPLVGRERKCEAGKVAIFPCQGVDLLSFLPIHAIGGKGIMNDIWGWTDPVTGREFVLAGHGLGLSIVEITDPVNPRYLGMLPSHGPVGGLSRGVKVYKNYAFVVAEPDVQGMQIFDLTQLRNVTNAPAVFRETAYYDRVQSTHNIVIDTASGFAYAVGNAGGEACNGASHMIDIRKPLTPTFVGCYATSQGQSTAYIHDAQCVVYHGPDRRYQNRELCLNANIGINALEIVDVTDKKRPKQIGVGNYPSAQLAHQGWLTEDHRYVFFGDEGDQQNEDRRTRTIIFDVSDLTEPVVIKEFIGANAIDHNQFIRGHYVYQANYAAGLQVLDIANPKEPKNVGYFDTDVAGKGKVWTFSGAWGNYPYFKNGAIAVSSMGDGLFVLRHRAGEGR